MKFKFLILTALISSKMAFASDFKGWFSSNGNGTIISSVVEQNEWRVRNGGLIVGTEKINLKNDLFVNDGIMISDDIFIETDEIHFGTGILKANKNLRISTKKYYGDFCHTGTGKVEIFVNGILTQLPNVEKEENPDLFFWEEKSKKEKASLFDMSEFTPLNSSNIFKYLTTKPLKIKDSEFVFFGGPQPYINTKNIASDRIEIINKFFVNNGIIQGKEIKAQTETFDFGKGSFCVTGSLEIHTKNLKIKPKRKHFIESTGSLDIYVDGVHRYSLADLSNWSKKK